MSNFNVFLSKSENFNTKWLEHFMYVPAFFEEIYNVCDGTKQDISEQEFFDFLPSYRLMQVDEILNSYEQTFKNWPEYDIIIPFLTDYSGCYYAYAVNNDKECIVLFADRGLELIHSEINDFWNTIVAFYDENVYFLDEDG